jgi:hypothetical protein
MLPPVGMVAIFLILLGLIVPVSCWLGLSGTSFVTDPEEWSGSGWPPIVAAMLALTLFAVPLLWVLVSRRMDLVSLSLAQNALIFVGYFFIETTAFKIAWEGRDMLRVVPLVLLFNAVGFCVLLLALGGTYGLATAAGVRLPSLQADPGRMDRNLRLFFLVIGLVAATIIALPMAASGRIPLLESDSTAARFEIVKHPALRALYHLGTALLPFVVGGLIVGIARRPIRAIGLDGFLVAAIVIIQLLTSNRLPLAITLVVTATLLSMERRVPRVVLAGAFAGYLVLFAGLSGFTGLLRAGDAVKENIVEESLKEAFLGDNLIDLRDGAWVFSHWDGQPLMGRTYLGGLTSMMPSALFPEKKEWHLGITGVRMVGWDPEHHFGLRITFFGESFLNFGWAGVVGLGVLLGAAFGLLLRCLHLAGMSEKPCLVRNVKIVMLIQMLLPLSNTSDAFTTWSMLGMFAMILFFVDLPARWTSRHARSHQPRRYAASRA